MLENLRKKLLLWDVKLRQHLRPLTSDIIVGKPGYGGLRRLLISVPVDPRPAPEILDFADSVIAEKMAGQVDLLVPKDSLIVYPKRDAVNRVVPLGDYSFGFFGFPDKALQKNLASAHYDFIIDLHRPLNLQVACLLFRLGAAQRMAVKSEYSSLFYNVEIVPQTEDYFAMARQVLSMLS